MMTRPPPHQTGPGAELARQLSRCPQRKPTLQTRVHVGMGPPARSGLRSRPTCLPPLRSSVSRLPQAISLSAVIQNPVQITKILNHLVRTGRNDELKARRPPHRDSIRPPWTEQVTQRRVEPQLESRGWFHAGKGALARARCPPVAAASSSSLIQPASASLAAPILPHPPATAVATATTANPSPSS